MHRKSTIIGSVLVALCIVAVASATAATHLASPHDVYNTPQALNGPGATIPLTATCERLPMSVAPAGKTVTTLKRAMFAGFNIYQQQIKCLVRRDNRIQRCFAQPVPTQTVFRGDDWEANNTADAEKGIDTYGPNGVDAFAAWAMNLRTCVLNVTGASR